MKQKIIPNIVKIVLAAGAVTLLAVPLQAGRGGNGAGGTCPQGFEPGTRNVENCTGDRAGAVANKGNAKGGQNKGQGACDGTGPQGGGGQGQGGKGQGGGQGTGNPEDCPVYNNRTPNP